jgi:alpha/beta superfamily hydrolase
MPILAPYESLTVESVHFPSQEYRLEGNLAYADGPPLAAVVLAGPHPLLGGTKDTKIVRALGDGLAARGFVTLRSNYRGVGASDGPAVDVAANLATFWLTSHAPDDPEKADDLRAAVAFLRCIVGTEVPFALAGHSFGCSLLPAAVPAGATAPPLVLIAPTIGSHDYTPYELLDNPKLIIAPHEDFATNADLLNAWFGRVAAPKHLVQPRLDGHFFRGHEDWLVASVGAFLDDMESTRT